ncbi:hypothetical protein [Frigidibacter sp. SD6-1]|uniref:hypothetical protein n=1 Tax=Frigidibacter sp. SD6-1 TaxID=3032581 RepID=UPI0024DF9E8C|nr:hypothetical protein [Frigidibacter sp. SD6-1]
MVITALFAVTQKRLLARHSGDAADRIVLANMVEATALLRLALRLRANDATAVSYDIEWADKRMQLNLQDVGGLIDLNTANPDLLSRLADDLKVSHDGMRDLREWRRLSLRLLSLQDFVRLTGAAPDSLERLRSAATVHSGRPGIDIASASLSALEIATGSSGTDEELRRHVPSVFSSQPTGTIFDVYLAADDGSSFAAYLGTIASDGGSGRILEMR